MKRNLTLWLGIGMSIMVYYFVHEGTHLVQAILIGEFDRVRLVGIFGVEIMLKQIPTGTRLALFSGVSNIVTLLCGYIILIFTPGLLKTSHRMLKIVLYYSTIILLVLDPIYLSILHLFVGGGDMNGITKGLGVSSGPVSLIFGVVGIFNLYLVLTKVHPVYKDHFRRQTLAK